MQQLSLRPHSQRDAFPLGICGTTRRAHGGWIWEDRWKLSSLQWSWTRTQHPPPGPVMLRFIDVQWEGTQRFCGGGKHYMLFLIYIQLHVSVPTCIPEQHLSSAPKSRGPERSPRGLQLLLLSSLGCGQFRKDSEMRKA